MKDITFELTWQEYAALVCFPAAPPPRPARASPNRIFSLGWVVLVVVMVAVFLRFDDLPLLSDLAHRPVGYLAIGFVVGLVVTVVTLIAFRKPLIRRNILREYETGVLDRVLVQQTIRIDANGLTNTTPHGMATTRWTGIEEIAERGDLLCLFISRMNAYVIPRRAFADPADFDRFANAARGYHAAANGEELPEVLPADGGQTDTRIQAK